MVGQFGESGDSRRQIDKDLGQNGIGKSKDNEYKLFFQKSDYKVKREGGIYWGIYNMHISISGFRSTVPSVRYINELLFQTACSKLKPRSPWLLYLTFSLSHKYCRLQLTMSF